jgi:signal transduction histidine kinase
MDAERDAWERLGWLWSAFYAVTLGVGGFFSALYADGTAAHRLLPVAGAGALLALTHGTRRRILNPEAPTWGQLLLALGWYATSLALLVLLLEPYPQFGIAVYGFVPTVFGLLPIGWALPAGVVVVPVLLIGQGGLSAALEADTWYSSLGSGLLALVIGVFMHGIALQSDRRRQAVEALTAAQAEVAAQARRAGVAEERSRLAREIHDTLAQGLVSVLTQVEAADRALARDPAAGAHHLDLAREAARAALEDARRSVQALRPASLQETPSLPAAIERVAGRWSAQSGVPAEVSVTGARRPLAPEVEVTLLRAAQEGLANVARHAGATRATVTLSYDGDEVAVDVDDDGSGFDPAALARLATQPAPDGGGFGIEALRERARALGGSAHVESEPGRGATLVLRVPAHPAEEAV